MTGQEAFGVESARIFPEIRMPMGDILANHHNRLGGNGVAVDFVRLDGLPWQGTQFSVLIENTAGAECSLGGSFDQVATDARVVEAYLGRGTAVRK